MKNVLLDVRTDNGCSPFLDAAPLVDPRSQAARGDDTIVWKPLSRFIKAETDGDEAPDASLAAVMSTQTFGEQVNYNPHIHVIAADGCFEDDGWCATMVTTPTSLVG